MRGGPSLKGKGGLVGFRKNPSLMLRKSRWIFEKTSSKHQAARKRFVSMRSHTANRSFAAGETSDGPPTL